jgi:hypothetical protein
MVNSNFTIRLRGLSSIFALLFPAVFCNSAKFQKVNFSGIWKIDSLKANYGGFEPAGTAVALKLYRQKIQSALKGYSTDFGAILFPLQTNYPLTAKAPWSKTIGLPSPYTS